MHAYTFDTKGGLVETTAKNTGEGVEIHVPTDTGSIAVYDLSPEQFSNLLTNATAAKVKAPTEHEAEILAQLGEEACSILEEIEQRSSNSVYTKAWRFFSSKYTIGVLATAAAGAGALYGTGYIGGRKSSSLSDEYATEASAEA